MYCETKNMKSLKEFLETSTIHGLHYISTSRNFIRLFWTCVVLTGLTASVYLIQQSFESWAESPITTAIDSQPTSEVQLPRVTVCPPKNTFTDLNFDLMNLNNATLNATIKDQVIRFAMEVIQDQIYQEIMSDLKKVEEEDRSYNWYNGFTQFRLPYIANDGTFTFLISTYKTSGQVSTQSFGLPFNSTVVDKRSSIVVYIEIHPQLREDKNVTLHLHVDKNSIPGLKNVNGNDDFYLSKSTIPKNRKSYHKSFTPPGKKNCITFSAFGSCNANSIVVAQNFKLKRTLLEEEFGKIRMAQMPGFKFNWYYTELLEEHEYTIYLKNPATQELIKFINLVSKVSTNYSTIWSQIAIIKADFMQKNIEYACETTQKMLSHSLIHENVEKLYAIFNVTNISIQPEKNLSTEMIDEGVSMFLYLNSCPNSHLEWINFYKDLFKGNFSLDYLILTLNRLRKMDASAHDKISIIKFASKIFEFLTQKLFLDYPQMKFFRQPNLTTLEAENTKRIAAGLNFVNHPVHIINSQGDLSPSSFIPFCELGGNMSSLGIKIKEFNVPVCNSFVPQIFHGQICYQIDLEIYRDNLNIEAQLKKGLVFIMDYNEDRQVSDYNNEETLPSGLFDRIDEKNINSESVIFLSTLEKGRIYRIYLSFFVQIF